MTNHTDGLSPDRGPAPAYRLAPDTPAEIAADLARLCAGAEIPASAPAARARGTARPASAANGLGPIRATESTAPARARPSRRLALFGAAAALLAPPLARPAVAQATAARQTPDAFPRGPFTLAQAEAVDFTAVWASLSPEVQVRIGALAIEAETFDQLGQDGGFHTTAEDRDSANTRANHALHEKLSAVICAALPGMLPTVYDEPYPLWQVLDERHPPAEVDVHGMGSYPLMLVRYGGWSAQVGPGLVELGGAVDLDNAVPGAPNRWQFWTAADIDVERLRRHPEMAGGTA